MRSHRLDRTLLQTLHLSSLGEGLWLATELRYQACVLCNREHNRLLGSGEGSLPSGRRAQDQERISLETDTHLEGGVSCLALARNSLCPLPETEIWKHLSVWGNEDAGSCRRIIGRKERWACQLPLSTPGTLHSQRTSPSNQMLLQE